MRIAILDLKADGLNQRTARTVSDVLRTEFVNIGKFIVIERNQMDQLLKEQGVQQSGCTDQACAVQLGKMMSARKILIGTVSPIGAAILINARIVDVERGIVEFAAMEKSASEIELDAAAARLVAKLADKIGVALPAVKVIPPPENLKASAGEFAGKIKVTWDDVPDAEKYEIFRSESSDGTFSSLGTTKKNKTTIYDNSAKAGTTYYYKVRALTKSGTGEFSMPAPGYVTIPAPADVTASGGDYEDRVELTWDRVTDCQEYVIYRSESRDGEYKMIDSVTENSFEDKKARAGITYYYRVKAKNDSGLGEFSTTASGYVKSRIPEPVIEKPAAKNEKKTEEKPEPVTMNGYYLRSIVPGWGQFYAGKTNKGFLYSGLFLASAGFSIWSVKDFQAKKADYEGLSDAPKSEFDSKYRSYQSAGYTAIASFCVLGAVYISHWVDAYFFSKPDIACGPSAPYSTGALFADIIVGNPRGERLAQATLGMRF